MGRNWDENEDNILKQLVATHGKQWNLIAQHLPKRTASQVAARWEKCLDPNITKGPFTAEEDQQIINYVAQNGPRGWPRITTILPNRSSKQCRERWFNHLDPSVKKVQWTPEEDNLIYQQHKQLGPKWSAIAKMIPGRTDNAIKNRWNSSISKRLQIDANGNEFVLPDSSRRQYKQKTPNINKKSDQTVPVNFTLGNLNSAPPNQYTPIQNQNMSPQILNNSQTQVAPQNSIILQNEDKEAKPVVDSNSAEQPSPHQIKKPPSLQIPDNIMSGIPSEMPSSNLGLPFTPFSLTSTPFTATGENGLFTPISPIPGFQSTPTPFGGLMSPNSSFAGFSPVKPQPSEGESFK